jgi:putative hemolysin
LYSHSLFHYGGKLLDELNPALELGRSFVCAEYQRSHLALMLLWRAIGAWIARHPEYRTLFGPVSISAGYAEPSRRLLVDCLSINNARADLAARVRPRTPLARQYRHAWRSRDLRGIRDLDLVSELIAQIEGDRKGVPVLIRQYVKLGGKFLGFNLDRNFSDAIDGLIVVDLMYTEPRVLEYYMGRAEAGRFLAYHRGPESGWRQDLARRA